MGYLDQNAIKNIETDINKTLIEKGITPSILMNQTGSLMPTITTIQVNC
jgi:hypothetical protein